MCYFVYNSSLCSGALHLAEEHATKLEKKLIKASEEACIDAEAKAASVDDLRDRIYVAERNLSEREDQIAKREAAIIV
jgi:hypothetical protein